MSFESDERGIKMIRGTFTCCFQVSSDHVTKIIASQSKSASASDASRREKKTGTRKRNERDSFDMRKPQLIPPCSSLTKTKVTDIQRKRIGV
jgi:hypothetical protein